MIAGTAAAQHAGPAVLISFVIAALGCLFAGLCYAEFAAMIPVSGSAYTYAYATMGRFIAWFIGWNLVLEYRRLGLHGRGRLVRLFRQPAEQSSGSTFPPRSPMRRWPAPVLPTCI